ncbi:hypothetical protein SERLA73DRAFT_97977 [Serpula lacrymans var. lacrymans S7.3]|uniref:Snf7-domain-containing protein n=2 Tax=Serpula lacrymans var. lacrymans TaxID=341189 RepID=F8QEK6_SERL3|nr:uncharacterized protein SERLADRAFT_443982 [Serpula lacrymans var. lacrymans S7.9]EGN93262.1 hypothetical protein SERLA73DRAFT_97977 [Serpula lacrymans var. lacrymans S7.3]EGO18645.1 hypothetical protein SERLADRAFT_443982 [Serpula lacrymans var. lacrymans S7.9]
MSTSSSFLTSLPTYSSVSQSRLQSLYSDISRQKHSNAASFNAYVDWWHRTLEEFMLRSWDDKITQSSPILDSQPNKLVLKARRDLMETFRLQGVGKPAGLATVIAELNTKKALISVSQYLSASQSIYESTWSPLKVTSYVLGKPLWWALQQLDIVQSEDSKSDGDMWKKVEGDYVVLWLLERAANVVEVIHAEKSTTIADCLFTFDSFRKYVRAELLSGVSLSELDTKVLLKFLERERGVIVCDDDVIKFVHSGKDKRVTTVDRGILELKSAVEHISAQIDDIQEKISLASSKISTALREKRKNVALSHLRSKKQLEDLLEKRLGSLDMLRSTMIRVEAAAGDIEIMKSYESSTATLREILAHPSLQRDNINETMDAMAAASADAREVEDVIKLGGDMATADGGLDEAEIEEEFRLLSLEVEEQAKVDKLHAAPMPPDSVPEPTDTPQEVVNERKPERQLTA